MAALQISHPAPLTAALQISQPAPLMYPIAHEFVSSFHYLQNNARNIEPMVQFIGKYYVNDLKTQELCSELERRLNPTNNRPVTDLITQNFFYDSINHLLSKHLIMWMELRSMNESFRKQLHSIAFSKKLSSVLFNAAAIICVAVAAIVAANVIPMKGFARAGIGAVAAVASLLFPALGRWRQSVLRKREATVNTPKEILERMIRVGRPIMTDLYSIYYAARSLEEDIKSLSEAVDNRDKLASVGKSIEKLLRCDDNYSSVVISARESILQALNT